MELPTGTRLGAYEILALIGKGGMGEVYRAKDTRLGRHVALKVLPSEFSEDRERLRRLEEEARSASSLNHPNIVTIHDIGPFQSGSYIAMEWIEGKTLREILASGPLPLRKTLNIAGQLADGLAKAHEVGIVHRDLKPENFMISKEGFAKILDFGLAKVSLPQSDAASYLSTRPQTHPGIILGTVAYMSPEQAAGQSVDSRSDQFSFGTILYEMITAKHPFHRKTIVETLSAVMKEEPTPVGQLIPQTPPPLRWIIERCMAKNPEDRYASTRDLAKDIQSIRDHFSEAVNATEISVPPSTQRKKLKNTWKIASLALLILFACGWFLLTRKIVKTSSLPSYQQLTYRRGNIDSAQFAPDGQTIIYSASFQGKPSELFLARTQEIRSSPKSIGELFMTRTQGVGVRPIGISNARILSISASGEMAILRNDGILAKVPLTGGAPRDLADHIDGASWAPDGSALAVVRRTSGKTRLEFPMGKVIYETSRYILEPRISSKGDMVAFREHLGYGGMFSSVEIIDLHGKKITESKAHSVNGAILWNSRGDEVWFTNVRHECCTEITALSVSGKERIIHRLPVPTWVILHDISSDGRALLRFEQDELAGIGLINDEKNEPVWLDSSMLADISADGKTLLTTEGGGPGGTFIRKTDGSDAIHLGGAWPASLSRDAKYALGWMNDPQRLVLYPTSVGEAKYFKMDQFERHLNGYCLFPDGKRILFSGNEFGHSNRAYIQEISGGKPRPITPEGMLSFIFDNGISPDGKFFVGMGTDNQIRLYSIEGAAPIPVAGIQEGEEPFQWSSDGKSLYVVNAQSMPVPIYKLNILNGTRTLIKELNPGAGIYKIENVRLTPDEKSLFYTVYNTNSTLMLVDGLK